MSLDQLLPTGVTPPPAVDFFQSLDSRACHQSSASFAVTPAPTAALLASAKVGLRVRVGGGYSVLYSSLLFSGNVSLLSLGNVLVTLLVTLPWSVTPPFFRSR